jgi:hypothetical protein
MAIYAFIKIMWSSRKINNIFVKYLGNKNTDLISKIRNKEKMRQIQMKRMIRNLSNNFFFLKNDYLKKILYSYLTFLILFFFEEIIWKEIIQ